MSEYYLLFKVVHIISIISWMAGMLYLPRLFVYHTQVPVGSDQDILFQKMEERLLRIIINPAMILSYIFGLGLAHVYGIDGLGVWFYLKLLFVIALTVMHHMFNRYRKGFVSGSNKYSERFFRIVNEVPTILMIVIVSVVVAKPFE